MKKKDLIRGERKVSKFVDKATEIVSTSDTHFAVPCFISGKVGLVIFAIIFVAAELSTCVQLVIDITILS